MPHTRNIKDCKPAITVGFFFLHFQGTCIQVKHKRFVLYEDRGGIAEASYRDEDENDFTFVIFERLRTTGGVAVIDGVSYSSI